MVKKKKFKSSGSYKDKFDNLDGWVILFGIIMLSILFSILFFIMKVSEKEDYKLTIQECHNQLTDNEEYLDCVNSCYRPVYYENFNQTRFNICVWNCTNENKTYCRDKEVEEMILDDEAHAVSLKDSYFICAKTCPDDGSAEESSCKRLCFDNNVNYQTIKKSEIKEEWLNGNCECIKIFTYYYENNIAHGKFEYNETYFGGIKNYVEELKVLCSTMEENYCKELKDIKCLKYKCFDKYKVEVLR